MYANKDIIAKDELGNIWKFNNLSCTSGSENLSYANFKDIKWSGTELTLSQNGETRIFYFDTPADTTHMAEIIKSVSQNSEKYNRSDSLESSNDYLEKADTHALLVETVKHQRRMDKNIKTITTILYIWITIVIVSLVISIFIFFGSLYNIKTLYNNYNDTQINNLRENKDTQDENQNNNQNGEDTQLDEDSIWDNDDD